MTSFSINSKNTVFSTFLVHFVNFMDKSFLPENLALSYTTSYRLLAPC